MIIIDIPDNPNCQAVDMRVFHDLEPAQRVTHVRLERTAGHPTWCAITGWTTAGAPCPALAQKIDDSGDGTAFLVYGGDAGVRLADTDHVPVWDMRAVRQWGEPFLIMADMHDLRLTPPSHKTA